MNTKALIELYDPRAFILNTISLSQLKPDVLAVVISKAQNTEEIRDRLASVIQVMALETAIELYPCDALRIADIEACLEGIIGFYGEDNCTIDVIGGNEIMLLASGAYSKCHPDISILSITAKADALLWLNGKNRGSLLPIRNDMSVREIITLAGGEMLRCGHADRREITDSTWKLIPDIFRVYLCHRGEWVMFVRYLQKLTNVKYRLSDDYFIGPQRFTQNMPQNRPAEMNMNIAMDLQKIGVIEMLKLSANNCTMKFSSGQIVRFLCDYGAWLELYLLVALQDSGLFSDLEINTVISWDNDADDADTVNEIDLIAGRGLHQLFISCKSAVPDNAALHEVAALAARFGAHFATPVLATVCDLEVEAPAVYRRARDMGILVIDAEHLSRESLLEILHGHLGIAAE